jgi:phosphoglycolate phosphatase
MPVTPTLLFDLDGTLVDSAADLTTALNCLRHDCDLPPLAVADVTQMVGDGARKLVQRALPEDHHPADSLSRFLAYYRQHLCEQTTLYPGVAELLREFRSYDMAIVTNKPLDLSEELLKRLDLGETFRCVIGGDSYPEKKPHPLPLLKALEIMRRPARHAIMIGDHHTDLHAGQAAGCRTCFCNWGLGTKGEANPSWEVDTSSQLAALLRSLSF